MRRGLAFWLLVALGAGTLANAAWMLIDPQGWYAGVHGVPDFGPYNEHFVRDIGCAFATAGLALVGAAAFPAARLALTVSGTAFFVLHALLHVFDTARGFVDAHHLAEDFPGVYLPAFLLLALCVHLWRRGSTRRA
jgi:hypothetical protein